LSLACLSSLVLMFVSKGGAYSSEEVVGCSTLGYILPTNITLGWKGLPGANTLALYDHS